MAQFFLGFTLVALSIMGLAAGLFLGRSPLRGTCDTQSCNKAIKCAGCQKARQRRAGK
jgi:hypothetical protein